MFNTQLRSPNGSRTRSWVDFWKASSSCKADRAPPNPTNAQPSHPPQGALLLTSRVLWAYCPHSRLVRDGQQVVVQAWKDSICRPSLAISLFIAGM